MAVSTAIPPSAVSRVVGYALDYRDLQTAAAVLPVRVLVLTDTQSGGAGEKITSADRAATVSKFGHSCLGGDVMEILDTLKQKQFIDVLGVSLDLSLSDLKAQISAGMGDVWYTMVVNPFAQNENVYQALREINGSPSETGGSGRWNAIQLKPFVAISGTTSETVSPLSSLDLTNVIGTAPRAFSSDESVTPASAAARVAASYTLLAFRQFAAKPHLDIAGQRLEYIPPPENLSIGSFESFDARDAAAKNGISTVSLDRAARMYVVQDFVTGYRPAEQGELAKSWRYVRDLFVDFNIAFNYNVLQARRLLGKVIISDTDVIPSHRESDVVRLSVWRAEVLRFISEMVGMLYITDVNFTRDNLHVELSGDNPKRLNTQFWYKRTSVVGISSTTAYVGFSFGSEG